MIHEVISSPMDYFNDQDGKRRWHEQTQAILDIKSGNGAIIWLGLDRGKAQMPEDVRRLKSNINEGFYVRVKPRPPFFWRWEKELSRIDGGSLAHVPPKMTTWEFSGTRDSANIIAMTLSRPEYNLMHDISDLKCGDYWVGMARFPLPPDWYLPESFWPGWTHMLHTNLAERALSGFNFITEYITAAAGYPKDLKDLTQQMAIALDIDLESLVQRDKVKAYWLFPWSNPRLAQHPLTGDVLS